MCIALGCAVASGQSLEPSTTGDITYLGGGIGADEFAVMRERAREFNVRLEFVELEEGSQHGNWTADAVVNIRSRTQDLAKIEVPGPMLLLRMPAGRYEIEAIRNGERVRMEIEVRDLAHPVFKRFIWRVSKGSLGSGLKTE